MTEAQGTALTEGSRILVTGGNEFVGNIVDHLPQEGLKYAASCVQRNLDLKTALVKT